jgi:hypothetical protein
MRARATWDIAVLVLHVCFGLARNERHTPTSLLHRAQRNRLGANDAGSKALGLGFLVEPTRPSFTTSCHPRRSSTVVRRDDDKREPVHAFLAACFVLSNRQGGPGSWTR